MSFLTTISSYPLDKVFLAYQVLQTGLVHTESQNSKLFSLMYKVQTVFTVVNISYIIWGITKIIAKNDRIKNLIALALSPKIGSREATAFCFLAASSFGWFMLTFCSISFINKIFKPIETLDNWHAGSGIDPRKLANIKVQWSNSSNQELLQGQYITQLVVSVALMCFSSPLIYGINTVLQLYSLTKISSWRWIRFDRTVFLVHPDNFHYQDGPKKITFSYFCSIFPLANFGDTKKSSSDDNCIICQEETKEETSFQFCSNGHRFHLPCFIGTLYGKSDYFFKFLLDPQNISRYRMSETRNGVVQREWIAYKIKVSSNDLPSCPTCRQQPPQNEINISVLDRFQNSLSDVSAGINLLPSSK